MAIASLPADSDLDTSISTKGPGEPRPPASRNVAKRRFNAAMKLARRVHLYAGLFMLPWVMLYGVTGALFNHPELFPDARTTSVPAASLSPSVFAELPSPTAVASEVVAALNQSGDYPSVELIGDGTPRYRGDLSFNVAGDGASHVVRVDPLSGDSRISTTPSSDAGQPSQAQRDENPLGGLASPKLQAPPIDVLKAAVPMILKQANLEAAGEPTLGRRGGGGSMTFRANVDGTPATLTYNLANGFVSARADDSDSSMSTRQFSLRLHMARGYEPQMSIRWLWALSVDTMAISMVGWGLTGLLMWWQLKRTRVIGSIVMASSVLAATFFTVGMHTDLSAAPGRGGHGGNGNSTGGAEPGGRGRGGARMRQVDAGEVRSDSSIPVETLTDDEFFDALLGPGE